MMNKPFYNGPKIEIGKDYLKIKKRNTRVNFRDIKSISIKYSRLDRAWLLYIAAGVIGYTVILCLFYFFVRGLMNDSTILTSSRFHYGKHLISLLVFFFIAAPVFIFTKVKKYFKKYLVLIIRWENHDFRIKISDLRITAFELKTFFEGKIKSVEFDIQHMPGKP